MSNAQSNWLPEELLPHDHPMILLDRVEDYGADFVEASFTVNEQSYFLSPQQQRVPIWFGLEYMAQTIGLFAGIQHKLANEPVKIGFLLGTRRYTCLVDALLMGNTYQVRASKKYEDEGLSVFDCTINHQALIAEASINVFQPDDPAEFFKQL
ncbi:hotdog family protein [Endozoicomonas sp. SM1973]|uniref:Hotdog family protein n=1 Tax=Spartinivicinus marinus TaxID=2994442 RepID=A0A853I3S0_9GAMM|nr:hotdog family protein [Spartinivicinus marinus]MCX4025403.1 hotdog family protein [Spartinivicinus marinus]NYZ65368.1 hotdog family protein [Spartinivicinus marinus]